MLLDYHEMLEYVKEVLIQREGIKSRHPYMTFRDRFLHIKRTYLWAQRIMEGMTDVHKEAVLTAAIFHDVGYAKEMTGDHAVIGAQIFEDYAGKQSWEESFIQEVSMLIQKHSHKELLSDPKTSKELILLMEADLLDEEGALGLAFDLLTEGAKKPTSYEAVFNEIMRHSAHILTQNYMVTEKAKKYWEEKKELIRLFLEELKFDLGMTE